MRKRVGDWGIMVNAITGTWGRYIKSKELIRLDILLVYSYTEPRIEKKCY